MERSLSATFNPAGASSTRQRECVQGCDHWDLRYIARHCTSPGTLLGGPAGRCTVSWPWGLPPCIGSVVSQTSRYTLCLAVSSCKCAAPAFVDLCPGVYLLPCSAPRLAQRGGIDRGGHGLHGREDLLGKEAPAFFSLVPGHPAVEHVHHEHVQADGLLQRFDLVDDLVRGADGLGLTAGGKARIGDPDIGSLALEVFLVAGDARQAGIIPFKVVMLRRL